MLGKIKKTFKTLQYEKELMRLEAAEELIQKRYYWPITAVNFGVWPLESRESIEEDIRERKSELEEFLESAPA